MTTLLKSALGALTATAALLAAAAPAAAEYLVPPENSAATQYTEAVPTAGGRRDAERDDGRGGSSPEKVLGPRTTRRLEAEGQAGSDLAELAGATAPPGSAQPRGAGSGSSSGDEKRQSGGAARDRGQGSGEESDSSAVREVIEQATGSSSSGELGFLLPLLIAAALAWSVWLLLRQRRGRSDPSASGS